MAANKNCVQYSDELAEKICRGVLTQSLHALIKNDNGKTFPSLPTVYDWFHDYPEFHEKYIKARKIRALHRVEEIDDIKEKLENGSMDVQIAKVWIDATKWQAGKENNKLFGDKIELSGDIDKPLAVSWVVNPVKPASKEDNANT